MTQSLWQIISGADSSIVQPHHREVAADILAAGFAVIFPTIASRSEYLKSSVASSASDVSVLTKIVHSNYGSDGLLPVASLADAHIVLDLAAAVFKTLCTPGANAELLSELFMRCLIGACQFDPKLAAPLSQTFVSYASSRPLDPWVLPVLNVALSLSVTELASPLSPFLESLRQIIDALIPQISPNSLCALESDPVLVHLLTGASGEDSARFDFPSASAVVLSFVGHARGCDGLEISGKDGQKSIVTFGGPVCFATSVPSSQLAVRLLGSKGSDVSLRVCCVPVLDDLTQHSPLSLYKVAVTSLTSVLHTISAPSYCPPLSAAPSVVPPFDISAVEAAGVAHPPLYAAAVIAARKGPEVVAASVCGHGDLAAILNDLTPLARQFQHKAQATLLNGDPALLFASALRSCRTRTESVEIVDNTSQMVIEFAAASQLLIVVEFINHLLEDGLLKAVGLVDIIHFLFFRPPSSMRCFLYFPFSALTMRIRKALIKCAELSLAAAKGSPRCHAIDYALLDALSAMRHPLLCDDLMISAQLEFLMRVAFEEITVPTMMAPTLHALADTISSLNVSVSSGASSADRLTDGNEETFWTSEGSLPHWLRVTLPEVMRLEQVNIYVNHGRDGSYTPRKVAVKVGDTESQLIDVARTDISRGTSGWVSLLRDRTADGRVVSVSVLENHENGCNTSPLALAPISPLQPHRWRLHRRFPPDSVQVPGLRELVGSSSICVADTAHVDSSS